MSVSKGEWKLIFNEFVKCAMSYMKLGYDLKNFLTWKKRLLICTVFVLIEVKTERSTWSSIAQKVCVLLVAYICMSAVFITKQKSLGWSKTSKRKRTFKFVESIGRKDQLNIHRLIWFEFVSIFGSKSVALCFGFYDAQVQLHMNF